MKTIMIPTTNKLYKITNYKEYELPNKVVDYIKQLEEESKNNYFIHMKEWAKAIGNNAKLRQIIDKVIEYCENITSREIDISDTDYELGEDFTARDILKILRGEDND